LEIPNVPKSENVNITLALQEFWILKAFQVLNFQIGYDQPIEPKPKYLKKEL
jgi:hypothetical protein